MTDTRETGRLPVGTQKTHPWWLLVGLIAVGALCGALLAVLEAGTWLALSAGVLVAFATVGLVRPRAEATSTSLVRHAESGWGYLRTELARSRRHDRRFAVVAIPADLWSPSDTVPAATVEIGLHAAASVQGLVRRPDRAWVDGSLLHILLTDCDRPQGLAFLARARLALPQLFDNDRVKLVVFPDDGLTSGALLAGLETDGTVAAEAERTGQVAAR